MENLENLEYQEWKDLPSLADAEPQELAHAIFDVVDSKKAENIVVLNVKGLTDITDMFVICTGRSKTSVQSMAGEVEYKLGLRGIDPLHFEGRDNNQWVVVDYGSVILHVFDREAREFYKLEKLFGDAESIHFESIDDKVEAKTAEEKQS